MPNPPYMADQRAKVAEVEAEDVERLVAWIRSRPGVIGPYISDSEVWSEAFRRFGGARTGLGFFKFNMQRIGYAVEGVAGGYRLDVSDPALVEGD